LWRGAREIAGQQDRAGPWGTARACGKMISNGPGIRVVQPKVDRTNNKTPSLTVAEHFLFGIPTVTERYESGSLPLISTLEYELVWGFTLYRNPFREPA